MVNKQLLIAKLAERGFSQSSYCKHKGINKNTFNAKVNGHSSFDTEEVKEICEDLGIVDNSMKVIIFLS